MQLLISHPPHRQDADLEAGAEILELSVADARLKSHYSIPEIWRTFTDEPEAEAATRRLNDAGLRSAIVPAAALAAIPARHPLVAFEFEDHGLLLREEEQATLPYDHRVVAVAFTPRQGVDRDPPSAFLDLYALLPGAALGRWTVVRGITGFGGVGKRQTASFGTNVQVLTDELEHHFQRIVVDRRLMNMQVRRHGGAAPPGAQRQGFSYSTASLNELLESIQRDLSKLEHDELTTRLAFLTHAVE